MDWIYKPTIVICLVYVFEFVLFNEISFLKFILYFLDLLLILLTFFFDFFHLFILITWIVIIIIYETTIHQLLVYILSFHFENQVFIDLNDTFLNFKMSRILQILQLIPQFLPLQILLFLDLNISWIVLFLLANIRTSILLVLSSSTVFNRQSVFKTDLRQRIILDIYFGGFLRRTVWRLMLLNIEILKCPKKHRLLLIILLTTTYRIIVWFLLT